jgi:hypothetical protein
MLNGSHSAMALMGAITGRPYIATCIGADHIREFVYRLMSREVAPHLSRTDWADYRDALIQRFGNPYLKHSVHQIATDSSQKIPQRWPPSVLGQMTAHASFEHHALAAAVFLRYTLGIDEQGKAYALNDPQANSLMAIGAKQAVAGADACLPDACGGLLALPWPDTLKSESRRRVQATVPREDKGLAQTPQMFRLGDLHAALGDTAASGFAGVTDEASAMEMMGHHPLLVAGSAHNFKVTYPQDFALAEAVLATRANTGS